MIVTMAAGRLVDQMLRWVESRCQGIRLASALVLTILPYLLRYLITCLQIRHLHLQCAKLGHYYLPLHNSDVTQISGHMLFISGSIKIAGLVASAVCIRYFILSQAGTTSARSTCMKRSQHTSEKFLFKSRAIS